MADELSVSISSFAVDDDRGEMLVGFQVLKGGEVLKELALARSGEQVGESLGRINAVVSAIAQGQADAGKKIQLDVYDILKQALLQLAAEEQGLTVE